MPAILHGDRFRSREECAAALPDREAYRASAPVGIPLLQEPGDASEKKPVRPPTAMRRAASPGRPCERSIPLSANSSLEDLHGARAPNSSPKAPSERVLPRTDDQLGRDARKVRTVRWRQGSPETAR